MPFAVRAAFAALARLQSRRYSSSLAKARPITQAGRARVSRALERHGLLLVQGQWEIPSLADLLARRPVVTRGYSWDYVPAWRLYEELGARSDVETAKLFRGRNTLIARRHWPALQALASEAAAAVRRGTGGSGPRRMLEQIEASPGIAGGELKSRLGFRGKAGSRSFQRVKTDLERWLCVTSTERLDLGYHTHESVWFPWARCRSARAMARRKRRLEVGVASESLVRAVHTNGTAASARREETLFPVLRLLRHA